MKRYFSLFLLSFVLFSCTIDQHVHFNSDGTGYFKLKYISTPLTSEDENGEKVEGVLDSLLDDPRKQREVLSGIQGITNVEINVSENDSLRVSKFTFGFSSLKSFNLAYAEFARYLSGKGDNFLFFSSGGNKVIFQLPPPDKNFRSRQQKKAWKKTRKQVKKIRRKNEADEVLQGPFSSSFIITISFDRTIAHFSNKRYKPGSDLKSIRYEGEFFQVVFDPKLVKVKIRLQ